MIWLQVREDARSRVERQSCLDYRLRGWLATRVGSRPTSSSWSNGRSGRRNVLKAEQQGINNEAPSRSRSSSVGRTQMGNTRPGGGGGNTDYGFGGSLEIGGRGEADGSSDGRNYLA